jgi:hypothetical protein
MVVVTLGQMGGECGGWLAQSRVVPHGVYTQAFS